MGKGIKRVGRKRAKEITGSRQLRGKQKKTKKEDAKKKKHKLSFNLKNKKKTRGKR